MSGCAFSISTSIAGYCKVENVEATNLLSDVRLTNYKERTQQIVAFLDKYIPDIERMDAEMQKYKVFFDSADDEIRELEASNETMAEKLKKLQTESTLKKLRDNQLRQDYEDAMAILDRIPPEVFRAYRNRGNRQSERISQERDGNANL